MRIFLKYIWIFLLIIASACLLLFLAGLLPQDAVQRNAASSMDQLMAEGISPGILYEGHPRSKLDNYSESRILVHSCYMDTLVSPASIFENPGWQSSEGSFEDGSIFSEIQQAIQNNGQPKFYYTRYWMGFRAVVRPMLAIMNYADARQCIQWAFYLLLGAVILQLYRKTGSFWIALGFMFAVSQMNPVVISASYQYATCFFIAFIGMLLVLALPFKRLSAAMLFFIIGAATQYFDFYTVPILTFGLPMLALLLRYQHEPERDFRPSSTARIILHCFAAWFVAYICMWLAKLTLTTLFTSQNAFMDAFDRVKMWLVEPMADTNGARYIPLALFYCAINIVDLVPLVLEAIIVIAYTILMIARKPGTSVFRSNASYLLVGLLPLIWIAATAKPSYDHMWFQYRGLCVTLYAVILFIILTVSSITKKQL